VGKHETGYVRVERDAYPTPPWCVRALAEFIALEGRTIWECAAGDRRMARALEAEGARVFTSDIEPHDGLDAVFDFLSPDLPPGLGRYDGIVTNNPWGKGNRLAVAFVEAGLRRIADNGGPVALLLPADFDSGVSRLHLFQHPFFLARIALTDRPVWFERTDGEKAQPKENTVWNVWSRPVLRFPAPPIVRHAVARADKARTQVQAPNKQEA
jgi:hypothetical protein